MKIKNLWPIIGLFLILMVLSSCGKKPLGYGILLWSPDEAEYKTGQNVTVISESELSDTFLISSEGNEPVQMERWRIEFFETISLADARSESIKDYNNIYARNLKDGLLLREKPNIDAARVYKMKKDQIIKVYDISSDLVEVGQYEGYWYSVITEDGIKGYSFDHYLDIFDSSVKEEEKINPATVLMNNAFSKVYRPESFITMIKESAIDLEYFKTQTGLFPDIENHSLQIVTHNYSLNFRWKSLSLIDKWSFQLDDTNVEVNVLSDTRLRVTYFYEGEKFSTIYQVIEGIEDIIGAEIERRDTLYQTLLESGTLFSSNSYGEIRMQFNGNFIWTNYDRLVPQIIPEGSDGTGFIRFNRFLSASLIENYTGILSLYFNYKDKKVPVYFMYLLTENNLQLTYVPDNDLYQNVVTKKNSSPVVLAFVAE